MSKKYEKEIEEILRQAEETPPQAKGSRIPTKGNPFTRALGILLGGRRWSLTPGRLMILSLILLLSALVFRPLRPALVGPVIWTAVLLFILSYALFFIRPGGEYQKRWRGRPMEEGKGSWLGRVRRWLRSR